MMVHAYYSGQEPADPSYYKKPSSLPNNQKTNCDSKIKEGKSLQRSSPKDDFEDEQNKIAMNGVTEKVKKLCNFILENDRNEKAKEIAKHCKETGYRTEDLEKIKSIDVWGRDLKELPEEIDLLKNLQVLRLSTNNLKSLPDSLKNLNNLMIVELYGNELTTFPKVLEDIKSLKQVFLGNNCMTTLPLSARKIIAHPLPNGVHWI